MNRLFDPDIQILLVVVFCTAFFLGCIIWQEIGGEDGND